MRTAAAITAALLATASGSGLAAAQAAPGSLTVLQTQGSDLLHFAQKEQVSLSHEDARELAARVVGLPTSTPEQTVAALPHADVFQRPSLNLLVSVPASTSYPTAVAGADAVAAFDLSEDAAGAVLEMQALSSFVTHKAAAEQGLSALSISASASAAHATTACSSAETRPCSMISYDRELQKFVIGGDVDSTAMVVEARGTDAQMLERVATLLSAAGVDTSVEKTTLTLKLAGTQAALALADPSARALIEELDAFTHSLPTVAAARWLHSADKSMASVSLSLSTLEHVATLSAAQRKRFAKVAAGAIFTAWDSAAPGPIVAQVLVCSRFDEGTVHMPAVADVARRQRQLLSSSPAASSNNSATQPLTTPAASPAASPNPTANPATTPATTPAPALAGPAPAGPTYSTSEVATYQIYMWSLIFLSAITLMSTCLFCGDTMQYTNDNLLFGQLRFKYDKTD